MNWKITRITIDDSFVNSVSWITSGGTELSVEDTVYSGSFDVSVTQYRDGDLDSGEIAVITISASTGTLKNVTLKRCVPKADCNCDYLTIL